MIKWTIVALLASALAGPAFAAPLLLEDGWIRAMPSGIPSGGYFTLRNETSRPVTLVGVASPACGRVMLHRSQMTGGMASMQAVSEVEAPAHGVLRFAPGGYHLMCTGARPFLKPGATVPVTLIFKDGEKLTANFAVRNAAGK
ncbi:MAG: copper chaperone PCu(A)C [Rhizomicrobium sp.]